MALPAEVAIALAAYAEGMAPERDLERTAVKQVLAELQRIAPGKSVELRIPPYAAVQVVAGPTHRRGTPKAIVELSAEPLLRLAANLESWAELKARGKISASGERSDLSDLFPLWAD